MDESYETTPEPAQESAGADASLNGKAPAHPADLEHQVRLAVAALEEIDMRLANVQAVNLMIFGAIVLVFALELRELKAIQG
jgi:hypothetical protein